MTTISVLQSDIDDGLRGDCKLCPVGRAGMRTAKELGYRYVTVGTAVITFFGGADYVREERDLPASARAFIRCFDNNNYRSARDSMGGEFKPLAPFQFEIEEVPHFRT